MSPHANGRWELPAHARGVNPGDLERVRWTPAELEARQGAMFDLMLGEVVEPLERVAPSELGSQPALETPRPAEGGPGAFSSQPLEERSADERLTE